MIIAGAKGFAKELLEVVIQINPNEDIVLFDDISPDMAPMLYSKFPILRSRMELENYIETVSPKYSLGLGLPKNRKLLYDIVESLGRELTSVISSKASIGKFGIEINKGANIMQGAVITSNVKIGKGVLLNINSTIGHDSIIDDFVEICPGVNISGNCHIGAQTFIGTNSTIFPGVRIGSNVTIGAGSVVTKDISDNLFSYGSPAKSILKS
jgi:sugar O-acyltransferase (sialic acid O-acetyltransferase NeuD family)